MIVDVFPSVPPSVIVFLETLILIDLLGLLVVDKEEARFIILKYMFSLFYILIF